MSKLIKYSLGSAVLSCGGDTFGSTNTRINIGLTAVVRPSCSISDVFVANSNFSNQIESDGSTTVVQLPVFNANVIKCNTNLASTSLKVASLFGGFKSGNIVLPYTLTGTFGSDTAATDVVIEPFHSATLAAADDAGGVGMSGEGIPKLWIKLNKPNRKVTTAGNYVDTLTLMISVNP